MARDVTLRLLLERDPDDENVYAEAEYGTRVVLPDAIAAIVGGEDQLTVALQPGYRMEDDD